MRAQTASIGEEIAAPERLADGDEYRLPVPQLLSLGGELFDARWTVQEGAGRPFLNGAGNPLAAPDRPLLFPRNFNRISAPDANGCISCHNLPTSGGGGDFTTNVFVLAQRFDHATFGDDDPRALVEGVDESGQSVDLDSIANGRATLGMNGSGYVEMLAREMTAELQRLRDGLAPRDSVELVTKGVSFGTLRRETDGSYDTSSVEGLPAPSLGSPPSLILRPFHQAGAVVSLRQFTNNAFNHHHGLQPTERAGRGTDPDGDGFTDELSRAEVTAVSLYQATLPVPGRVIPRDPEIEEAVLLGEETFDRIGCARCHVSALPLTSSAFVEPNPFNPTGNLRPGDAPDLAVALDGRQLPQPRLGSRRGVTWVPAFTDLKLHDITSGPSDPNREPLDMHYPPGSREFFAGNSRFLTRKLWGAANEPPYFHHGRFTTLREAILAHAGEADAERAAFESLPEYDRDAVIEFLKTLQILPAGTRSRFVDERYRPRQWPPAGRDTPLLDRSDLNRSRP